MVGGLMSDGETTVIAEIEAPFGQNIQLLDVQSDQASVRLMRLRIREGSRFTVFDLDPATAKSWGEALIGWATKEDIGVE